MSKIGLVNICHIGLKTELRQGYMPALDIRLDGDMGRFIDNYSGQHYAICYGDLSGNIADIRD